jgi:hypothetical protein
MTWQLFDTEINGTPAQVLLDDSFNKDAPSDELPTLTRFAVFCQQPAEGTYWHPDEAAALDKVENDLLGASNHFGKGWVVYVRRVDSPGLREYYLYSGGDADLAQVLPALTALHPDYRIEVNTASDPGWKQYSSWLAAQR